MLEPPELAGLAAVPYTCMQPLPGDAFWLVMEVSKTDLSGASLLLWQKTMPASGDQPMTTAVLRGSYSTASTSDAASPALQDSE